MEYNSGNNRALPNFTIIGFTAQHDADLKLKAFYQYNYNIISNYRLYTKWNTIWGESMQVISQSDKRKARDQFEITSMITP